MRRMLQFGILAGFVLSAAAACVAQDKTPETALSEVPETGRDSSKQGILGEMLPGQWTIDGSLQVRGTYDDNVFVTDAFRKSDIITQFSGDLSVLKRTPRAKLEFHYMPEYDVHRRYDAFDSFSQGYAQSVTYEVSKYTDLNWELGVRNIPARNSLPFSFFSPLGFAFSSYNPQALQNGIDILAGNTTVGLAHRLTRHTRVNASGLASAISFSKLGNQVLTGQPRLDYSGGLQFSLDHDLAQKSTIGFRETSTYFAFVNPGSHQFFHTLEGTYKRDLGHGFSADLGAGPSFSEAQNFAPSAPQNQSVSYAIDASVEQRFQLSTFYLRFTRGEQLGLLQGSLTAYSAVLGARRPFAHSWIASASVGYSRSDSVIGFNSTQGEVVTGNLEYRVSPVVSAVGTYSFALQHGENTNPFFSQYSRNQIAFGFRYTPRGFGQKEP